MMRETKRTLNRMRRVRLFNYLDLKSRPMSTNFATPDYIRGYLGRLDVVLKIAEYQRNFRSRRDPFGRAP